MEVSEFVILSNNTSISSNSNETNNDSSFRSSESESEIKSEKIYLDYNATTPLEKEVVEAINKSLEQNWSNPSSQYKEGKEAKVAINRARSSIAQMINAKSPQDIVFVSGGTEANNIVFYSMLKYYEKCQKRRNETQICEALNNLKSLPHMIISEIEHDSVKLIAENYEKDNLAEITYIRVNEHGLVSVDDIVSAVKPNTILISLMLANNETGVIQPVGELTKRLKTMELNNDLTRLCPIYVHTDAAQAIGKIAVDVEELGVDYLTIVGHKFYAPRIGALFARNCQQSAEESKKKISPLYHMFYGAGQENGLRPGTENTPMIVGLGKAAELVSKNLERYSAHMSEIRDYLEHRLVEEFGAENLRFNGRSEKSTRLPNTCNVSFTGNEEYKGFLILNNTRLIEASTGACCHSGLLRASKILLAMGIDKSVAANAIRLSVGRETNKRQIDLAIEDLKTTLKNITH